MNSKKTQSLSKVEYHNKTNRESTQLIVDEDVGSEVLEQNDVRVIKDKSAAETGGPKGLEPTRYGDWEQKGRCTDF